MKGMYSKRYEHDACGVGFIATLTQQSKHSIVDDALTMLANMEHRGGHGADFETGDGAGILVAQPFDFWRKIAPDNGITLPESNDFAVGTLFCSPQRRVKVQLALKLQCGLHGLDLLGWREIPVNDEEVGLQARSLMPLQFHVFIGGDASDIMDLERKLYLLRKGLEQELSGSDPMFYLPSLSARTISFVGMLKSTQVKDFYLDLTDPDFTSPFAIVHSRFSTNTMGSWSLAHPFRYIAHNGEINTIIGNANWMKAREGALPNEWYGHKTSLLTPIIREDASDSAQLDNAVEFLHLSGRDIAETMLTLITPAWAHEDPDIEAYNEYRRIQMEAWDGPAAVCYTDGSTVGAILDRNGLRPMRYTRTKDRIIMASESGALEVPPEEVLELGRLGPGQMLNIDTATGEIADGEALTERYAHQKPYLQWIEKGVVDVERKISSTAPNDNLLRLQSVFSYTLEDMKLILPPMATLGKWAIGSMGNDAALACLSDKPQLLYRYFKQRFAQVSNPAMDSINERPVMSLQVLLGKRLDILQSSQKHAEVFRLPSPIMTGSQLANIQDIASKTSTLDCTLRPSASADDLKAAVARLSRQAADLVREGTTVLILSDEHVSESRMPVPMLLAVSRVHQELVKEGLRTQASLVCKTGEAREVPHFAFLLSYGADAICPYLALQTIASMASSFTDLSTDKALENYLKAADAGLLKTIAKMGISTIRSYQGAQICEAIGLSEEVINDCFPGTTAHMAGVGYDVLARESRMRHDKAFKSLTLDQGGDYQWRKGQERHSFAPETIAVLQESLSHNSFDEFLEFSSLVDSSKTTVRSLMGFRDDLEPIPLDEVESAESIATRFCTGAMSYGSISKEAHETLAVAMNKLGGKSNSGEGGEDPARFKPDLVGISKRSAIKQVASGRFGVTSHYLNNADEIQIKIAQGAKPGEGGELPGHKVSVEIARVRKSTPGVGLISPPPHHDIYSIEDLAQLIFDLKHANPDARISVKLVASAGVGTIAAGVAKANADNLLISGHDGGTGASPQASIKYAGIPWELGLAEVQQTLVQNDLRGRIRVQADGGLKTGRDVVIAALLGAEEFGFSTAPLVAMGCILMRVCHKNTCPVGIATQDPKLRQLFNGTPDSVIRYFLFVAEEARRIMASFGVRTMEELIGRTDLLIQDTDSDHWKQKYLNLDRMLHFRPERARRHIESQNWRVLEQGLDTILLRGAKPAFDKLTPVTLRAEIKNTDRAVGTRLGSAVTRITDGKGMREDTICCELTGHAGQSLGAFCPTGITLSVTGDANDYVGKGLCGGKIAVKPSPKLTNAKNNPIIIGNVALYGATSGNGYFRGMAGERFAVRNSGAVAVVEGVGDHGCEYMTGGTVLIIGHVGRNFAAGMTGGRAYVFDPNRQLDERTNHTHVDLDPPSEEDLSTIKQLLESHLAETDSPAALEILDKWDTAKAQFIAVYPRQYKEVLSKQRKVAHSG